MEPIMKKELGALSVTYPTLTLLVGTLVAGKPNFITIAHQGILNHANPQYISIGVGKTHYSNQGIKLNKTFSINVPSEDLVIPTDYVGMYSGHKHDKSKLFDVFYGELKTAPMIKSCGLNAECKLYDVYDLPTHEVFIGEIVQTYCEESILREGKIDISKLNPLLFDMSSRKYWSLGREVAQCWSVGKNYKPEE
jgi:flavin reductase (DIM6/NTAB) family NADH-FMN oxidoreductase RutF